MNSKYKKNDDRRCYQPWPNDAAAIQAALADIRMGITYAKASETYGIPVGSLHNRMKQKHVGKPGRKPVFTPQEEEVFTAYIITLGDWNFPFDKVDLKFMVKSYLDKLERNECRFANNMPGDDWINNFLQRNPILKLRVTTNITVRRSQVSENDVKCYFEQLITSLKDVEPEKIINFDETNFTDTAKRKKCLFRHAVKYPQRVMNSTKYSVSVMFAATPFQMLPPYVVYKSENFYSRWCQGGPINCRYNRSKSGWFDTCTFEDWFKTLLLPFLESLGEGPKAVIGDNLASHFSPEVIQICKEHDIRFICLPPNSTHLCQPLDVAVFSPMKRMWRAILDEFKSGNRGATLNKELFPSLLKECLDSLEPTLQNTLKSGFRKCGLVPLNENEVLRSLPNTDDVSLVVSEVVKDMLSQLRSPEQRKVIRRKRKVNVIPGKSVSSEDFLSPEAEQDDAHKKTPKKRGRPRKPERNSTEDDSKLTNNLTGNCPSTSTDKSTDTGSCIGQRKIRKHTSSSSSEDEALLKEMQKTLEESDEYSIGSRSIDESEIILEVGRWVLVRCTGKKSQKYYVGQILDVIVGKTEEVASVKFLRKMSGMNSSTFAFGWPNEDEIADVNEKDVVMVLPKPNHNRRGLLQFSVAFDSYRHQLS